MIYPEVRIPQSAPNAGRSIWTPTEVTYLQSWLVHQEGVRKAIKHEFMLKYRGEEVTFGVIAEEDEGDALIEDMAASLAEREMVRIVERQQERAGRLIPEDLAKTQHLKVRRELAAAMRDYIAAAKKRATFTTGKRYFVGLK